MSSRKLCGDCTRIECVKGCTCDCHSIKSTKKMSLDKKSANGG